MFRIDPAPQRTPGITEMLKPRKPRSQHLIRKINFTTAVVQEMSVSVWSASEELYEHGQSM